MSEATLWYDMYKDVAAQLDSTRSHLLDEVHQERMRVIKLEGHRLSLLSHLRSAGNLLKNTYPIASARFLEVAQEIADDYAAKPKGEVASTQTPDNRSARSSDNSPLYAQTGTTQGPF